MKKLMILTTLGLSLLFCSKKVISSTVDFVYSPEITRICYYDDYGQFDMEVIDAYETFPLVEEVSEDEIKIRYNGEVITIDPRYFLKFNEDLDYSDLVEDYNGDYDEYLIENEMYTLLDMIPDEIVESFSKESGRDIIITDYINKDNLITNNDPKFDNWNVEGFYCEDENLICVQAYAIYDAFVHEIGHYVDTIYKPTKDKVFKTCYERDIASFKFVDESLDIDGNSEYTTSTIQEYFADSYKSFIIRPDRLSTYCPSTYEYLVKLTAKING